ncbi:VanZ family protein [Corynebacterium phocae]|uniref:VanZ family protein n=1 Tax=Corynebacterium phocae TaxID=161895 RepID=UPI003CCBBB48
MRYASTACYLGVVLSLTTLKAFFQIGYLWLPENQRVRQLRLIPLDDLFSGSWFKPLFEYGGNLALFIPLGALLFMFLGKAQSVAKATLVAAGISLGIELTQFAFALGRTDVDDLAFNTLGAWLGALMAARVGPRWFPRWQWLAIALAALFALLVALGPRLGDPEKVRDLSVGHVDELGVMQLVGDSHGVNGPATVLG